MKWSFALTGDGDLHILPHEMPAAENLVVVDLIERDGMHVIKAADAAALRELLGTPLIRTVVQHTGPDVADELDDLLAAIQALVDNRTAKLRGEEPTP
jgi:hypothetical protein